MMMSVSPPLVKAGPQGPAVGGNHQPASNPEDTGVPRTYYVLRRIQTEVLAVVYPHLAGMRTVSQGRQSFLSHTVFLQALGPDLHTPHPPTPICPHSSASGQ